MKNSTFVSVIIISGIFFRLTVDLNTLYNYSTYRQDYSVLSDTLNDCIQLSQKDDFSANQKRCQSFNKQNLACEVFPERNPDCKPFLESTSYHENRNFCNSWLAKDKKCKKTVRENLWYSTIIQILEGELIKNIAQWTGYPLDTKLAEQITINGIKIKDSWYKHVTQLDDSFRNIYIATLAAAKTELDFFQGVELAAEKLNQSGGVSGRKIQLVRRIDDGSSEDWNRNTVNDLIKDKKIVAIINRHTSEVTKPLTILFEEGGMLNLTISAANVNIILSNMKYNFRTHPNNAQLSRESAKYCFNNKHRKLAMITAVDAYSQEVGREFFRTSLDLGMRISYIKTVSELHNDFTSIINDIKKQNVDAIFLSATRTASANFVSQCRRFGITLPIYGSKTLENKDFILQAGVASEGIVVPSIYNESLTHRQNVEFIEAYRAKYGRVPSTWSVQGYDALNIIAQAIEYIHATEPLKIGSIIRYRDNWMGAGGNLNFTESGEVKERQIFFKKIQNGDFRTINP